MSTEVIVAVISGVLTLAGVIITVAFGNSKTLYRIEQLEKKQDKHNSIIERMYKAEKTLALTEEKLEEEQRRLAELEEAIKKNNSPC